MKFLRKTFLRSPESVYHLYAYWAGVRFVLNAFFAVIALSMPIGLILFVLTESFVITLSFAPILTFFAIKGVVRVIYRKSAMKAPVSLYGDAKIDRELGDIAVPISKKAGFTQIPVMYSRDVAGEAGIKSFGEDFHVILVRPDIHERHTITTLRGIIAHEVGHLCVPLNRFIKREIGPGFLVIADCCSLYLGELSARCFRCRNKNVGETPMFWLAIMLSILAQTFWFLSRSRSEQLNEYAADYYGAHLLGDPSPVAEMLLQLARLEKFLGGEGDMKLVSHPPLATRANRLLDLCFIAHGKSTQSG